MIGDIFDVLCKLARPLLVAAREGHVDIVGMLLAANAHPDDLRSVFYITYSRSWFLDDNFKFDGAPLVPSHITRASQLLWDTAAGAPPLLRRAPPLLRRAAWPQYMIRKALRR